MPADKPTLHDLADATGGSFHAAASAEALQSAYRDIGQQVGYTTAQHIISWRFLVTGLLCALGAGATAMLWADRLLYGPGRLSLSQDPVRAHWSDGRDRRDGPQPAVACLARDLVAKSPRSAPPTVPEPSGAMLMPIRRRPDHRGHTNEHDNAPDHLDDLRALLPEQFRNASDAEIAQLWLAWVAARRGHGVNDLIKTYAVSADIAARMVALAGRGHRRTDAH